MYITACKVENNICKSQVEQLTMGQNAHFVWGKMPTGHFSRHFPPPTPGEHFAPVTHAAIQHSLTVFLLLLLISVYTFSTYESVYY